MMRDLKEELLKIKGGDFPKWYASLTKLEKVAGRWGYGIDNYEPMYWYWNTLRRRQDGDNADVP